MKKINLALLTLATLMGVSSTAVVFADDATSTGTLEITDGDVTLNSIDSLDFGSFQYNTGSTQDTGANLTINGVTLTSLSGAVFTKAADNENFGQQSLNIDKDSTNIALTKDQAKATAGKSITLNVDWTISKTVTKASDFN
ncbi:hypothetical protein LSG16_03800 [Lactococcus cremoris]|uniref:hypothetical protein n=1 Tax=Lactococcus lactis subsp. cremoris TaxID=1359 RepID=UPI001E5029ED|nr:hypothetical protein [Lactococcus cremoris]MCD6631961.1 hypothetical protein [Lactococcus cremoris]